MYKQYISKEYLSKFNKKYMLLSNKCSLRFIENIFEMYWGNDFYNYLFSYCLLIIKPECIAFNKLQKLIEILKQYKFELVYYKQCILTPTQVFEVWEDSWQTVAYEHMYINQKLYAAGNSIILILKNNQPTDISACEFLTDLKGSAYAERRKDYQIRTILQPLNISLNFIHTSDTLFDLVYEMGILFSSDEIQSIIKCIETSSRMDYNKLLQANNIYTGSVLPKVCLADKIKKLRYECSHKIDIIDKLISILNRVDEFQLDFIFRLEHEQLLDWDWSWILIISSYIKYKTSPS